MNSFHAYSFLAGIFIGGYTNFFSKIVISGLVLYIVHPNNFTFDRFQPLYNTIKYSTEPYVSKIYDTFQKSEERVSVIASPLPPLTLKVKKQPES